MSRVEDHVGFPFNEDYLHIRCTCTARGQLFRYKWSARLEHGRELLALPGTMDLSPYRKDRNVVDLTCRKLRSVGHDRFKRNFEVWPNN